MPLPTGILVSNVQSLTPALQKKKKKKRKEKEDKILVLDTQKFQMIFLYKQSLTHFLAETFCGE